MLSPKELGSTSAELIRILLFHSYTQRASIVASPPIGGSRHKNYNRHIKVYYWLTAHFKLVL